MSSKTPGRIAGSKDLWSGLVFIAFGLLGLSGVLLSRISESAHPTLDVVPGLLANAAFVIAGLSTTSIQTFMNLQRDEAVFCLGDHFGLAAVFQHLDQAAPDGQRIVDDEDAQLAHQPPASFLINARSWRWSNVPLTM